MNTQMLNLICSIAFTILLGVIILPILRKYKIGQTVRSDGPESHLKKNGTPIMGGIMMIIVLTVLIIINGVFKPTLFLALVPILGFGIVGFVDDYKKLVLKSPDGFSPKLKMLGLLVFSIVFIALYLYVFRLPLVTIVPFLNQPVQLPTVLFVIFALFILLGTSNSVNLTDGLDGLASGVVAIIMTFFTLEAFKLGNSEMVTLGIMTVGTCLAFLLFNAHPAKVFMGDTGSLALGGAVAAISLILNMPLYLAIVAIVCIIDTISVMLQVMYFKITKGKRLFKMAPFHHHLELSGMKEQVVVMIFWLITAIACTIMYFV